MKKILSLALVSSLMLGTVAVKAQTQTTDLVAICNFDSLSAGTIDDAGLSALGITANTADKATMTVKDLSTDATYGGLKKVLSWKPSAKNSKITFPISYTLKADEKLVVEYDYKWEATSAADAFGSGTWGSVNLVHSIKLAEGGNGWLHRIWSSGNDSGFLTLGNSKAATYCQENWLHVKTEYDYASYLKDNSTRCVKTKISDVANGKERITINSTLANTEVGNLVFDNVNGLGQVYLDNIHVYTVPQLKLTSSTITDGAEKVFYDTKEINLSFSNEIADASAVTVSKDGAAMASGSYTVVPSGKSVKITFAENLDYSSVYTVSLAGVVDDLGQVFGENNISFTVEDEPDIRLDELKLTKGIGGTMENVSELKAVNGLQTISLEIENLKEEAKNVNVIFAIYEGANRQLSEVRNVETVIPANETRTVSVGTDMTNMQGKVVKAFVWDSYSSMKPWFGHTQLEIK